MAAWTTFRPSGMACDDCAYVAPWRATDAVTRLAPLSACRIPVKARGVAKVGLKMPASMAAWREMTSRHSGMACDDLTWMAAWRATDAATRMGHHSPRVEFLVKTRQSQRSALMMPGVMAAWRAMSWRSWRRRVRGLVVLGALRPLASRP